MQTKGWRLKGHYPEEDFAGALVFSPSLFLPFKVTLLFHYDLEIGIEHSTYFALLFDPFHPSDLLLSSVMELDYFAWD